MNIVKRLRSLFSILIIFSLTAVYLNGCGEDSITTPPGEHFEPAGLFVIPEGSSDTILTVFEGIVRQGDTLKAPLNVLTDHWEVYFWDANRNVLEPPTDGQHNLGFTIRDASVAETIMDNPSDWAFHLKGLSLNPDTTSMQIKVFHLGHSDFTTPFIPVKVDPCEIPGPAGFVIVDTVTSQIVYRDSLGEVSGDTIRIISGGSSNRLKIYYFDAEGFRFQPCVSQYILSALFNPAGIAGFVTEPGEWNFRISAIAQGNTLMSIRLHRNGNFIYGTRNIPVKVGP